MQKYMYCMNEIQSLIKNLINTLDIPLAVHLVPM